jgi:hypothetical protein
MARKLNLIPLAFVIAVMAVPPIISMTSTKSQSQQFEPLYMHLREVARISGIDIDFSSCNEMWKTEKLVSCSLRGHAGGSSIDFELQQLGWALESKTGFSTWGKDAGVVRKFRKDGYALAINSYSKADGVDSISIYR